jgi:hypothetical protein
MSPITPQVLYDALRAAAADLDAYGSSLGNDGIVAIDGRFDLTAMANYLNGPDKLDTDKLDTERNIQAP